MFSYSTEMQKLIPAALNDFNFFEKAQKVAVFNYDHRVEKNN